MADWITCDNVYEESWRRILEFANIELAIDAIESIHGKSTKTTIADYKKQAQQTRVALLQAKEYFEAAKASSLFTQPNPLYYGTVALSTACMLIRGDGTKSLDFLRKNNKNNNHGLNFSFSSNINRAKEGMTLLENSYIEIRANGHFSNWYETLLNKQHVSALYHNNSKNSSVTNLNTVGSFDIPNFSELKNNKKSLLSLIKRLPDLYSDLGRFGVIVEFARGEHIVNVNNDTKEQEHTFVFHQSPSYDILIDIVKCLKCESGVLFSVDIEPNQSTGVVITRKGKQWPFSFPDSRETLDHRKIFYKESMTTPEVIDLFLVSYALSMLCRYFPDIWISFLESHCKGAKLVERIVHLLLVKIPNLMLNQIAGKNYIISTHRPYWH